MSGTLEGEGPAAVESKSLRRYQEIICAQAVRTSTIAFLPTGAGKTLIACHVISQRLPSLRLQRESISDIALSSSSHPTPIPWKKIMIFVAPKGILLQQQLKFVKSHCLANIRARSISKEARFVFHTVRSSSETPNGNSSTSCEDRIEDTTPENDDENCSLEVETDAAAMDIEEAKEPIHSSRESNGDSEVGIDFWQENQWRYVSNHYELLFMTPEILRHALAMRTLDIKAIDFLVLDECHHIKGNSAMGKICDLIQEYRFQHRQERHGVLMTSAASKFMKDIDDDTSTIGLSTPVDDGPLILGLTASPSNEKNGEIRSAIEELEKRTSCKFCYPTAEFMQSLKASTSRPNVLLIETSDHLPSSPPLASLTIAAEQTDLLSIDQISSSDTAEMVLPSILNASGEMIVLSLNLTNIIAAARKNHFSIEIVHQLWQSKWKSFVSSLPSSSTLSSSSPIAAQDLFVEYTRLTPFKELFQQTQLILDNCGFFCGLCTFQKLLQAEVGWKSVTAAAVAAVESSSQWRSQSHGNATAVPNANDQQSHDNDEGSTSMFLHLRSRRLRHYAMNSRDATTANPVIKTVRPPMVETTRALLSSSIRHDIGSDLLSEDAIANDTTEDPEECHNPSEIPSESVVQQGRKRLRNGAEHRRSMYRSKMRSEGRVTCSEVDVVKLEDICGNKLNPLPDGDFYFLTRQWHLVICLVIRTFSGFLAFALPTFLEEASRVQLLQSLQNIVQSFANRCKSSVPLHQERGERESEKYHQSCSIVVELLQNSLKEVVSWDNHAIAMDCCWGFDESIVFAVILDMIDCLRRSLTESNSFRRLSKKFTNEFLFEPDVMTLCPTSSRLQSRLVSKRCDLLLDQLALIHIFGRQRDEQQLTSALTRALQETTMFHMENEDGFPLEKHDAFHHSPRLENLFLLQSESNNKCDESGKVHESATIVFCGLRMCAQSLHELIESIRQYLVADRDIRFTRSAELTNESAMDVVVDSHETLPSTTDPLPNDVLALSSGVLVGTFSHDKLSKTLHSVRRQETNILFATDVAEEGLDIKNCAVVIHFDEPCREVSFIQRRGRARASKALSIHFVDNVFDPFPVQDSSKRSFFAIRPRSKHVKELEKFMIYEESMRQNLIKYLDDYAAAAAAAAIHGESALFNPLQTSQMETFMAYDQSLQQISTENDTVWYYPSEAIYRTQFYYNLVSGARVDCCSAMSLINTFCSELSNTMLSRRLLDVDSDAGGDGCDSTIIHPVFIYETIEMDTHCRMIWSTTTSLLFLPLFMARASNKYQAKGLVCLSAVQYLHQMQLLDDNFRLIRWISEEQHKAIVQATLSREGLAATEDEVDVMINNRPAIFDAVLNDNSDINCEENREVRAEQESRDVECSGGGGGRGGDGDDCVLLHVYGLSISNREDGASPIDEIDRNDDLVDKQQKQIDALESMGVATLVPWPHNEPTSVPIVLKNIKKSMKVSHLKTESIGRTSEKLALLRTFHDCIAHIRTYVHRTWTQSDDPFPAANSLSGESNLFVDENTAFLPLPLDDNERPLVEEQEQWLKATIRRWTLQNNEKLEDYLVVPVTGMGTVDLLQLRTIILEVHAMIVNLQIIQVRNFNHFRGMRYTDPLKKSPNLEDCIFSSSGRNLYSCCDNEWEMSPKSLLDLISDDGKTTERFVDYYLKSTPSVTEQKLLLDQVHNCVDANTKPMQPAYMMTGKLTLIDLYNNNDVDKSSNSIQHVLPSRCFVVGKLTWFNMLLLAPAVLSKFESLYLAFELESKMKRLMDPLYERVFAPMSVREPWPCIAYFLKAMTPRRMLECLSSERLEFLGDSFLKYYSAVSVFVSHPMASEGTLSTLRTQRINNDFLSKIGIKHDLASFLRVCPLSDGKQQLLYCIPASDSLDVSVDDASADWLRTPSLRNQNVFIRKNDDSINAAAGSTKTMAVDDNGRVSDVMVTGKTLRGREAKIAMRLPKKLIADLVEALVGLFCEHSGWIHAGACLHALGVVTLTSTIGDRSHKKYLTTQEAIAEYASEWLSAEALDIPMSLAGIVPLTRVDLLEIKNITGYCPTHPALFTLAFTHGSVNNGSQNLLSYERLEFLGDAVLDLLVVQALYREHVEWDEGRLTQNKSIRTRNSRLCEVALKKNLLQFIRCGSLDLELELVALQKGFEAKRRKDEVDEEELLDETAEDASEASACSIAADVVEALLGAIFLDCRGDLDVLSHVIRRMGIL